MEGKIRYLSFRTTLNFPQVDYSEKYSVKEWTASHQQQRHKTIICKISQKYKRIVYTHTHTHIKLREHTSDTFLFDGLGECKG